MKKIRITLPEFIKKYKTLLQEAEEEMAFCKVCCKCLTMENLLEEKDEEVIVKFLEEKIFAECISKKHLNVQKKIMFLTDIFDLFWDLNRVWNARETFHKRCSGWNKEYIEFLRNKDVKEEIYINDFYFRMYKFLFISEMYKEKYELLKKEAQNRSTYVAYEKESALNSGYYHSSAIEDLVIENIKEGKLLKNCPKSSTDRIEHYYDKTGNLIMSKWYINEILYACDFVIYSKEYVLNITYAGDTEKIHNIVLRKYEADKIMEVETVSWYNFYGEYYKGFLGKLKKEIYEYDKNGYFSSAIEETYIFPQIRKDENDKWFDERIELLTRDYYCFIWDELENIKGYIRKNYLGEILIESKSGYVELKRSKKRLTGRDDRRWKRPNYFERR